MRRRDALRLLGATALPLCLSPLARAAQAAEPPLQRGVGLGLFSEDPLFSYAELLREIRELGTTHVALTVACYQEHARSTSIYLHPRFSPPDLTVARTLREAREAGLKVMVFPIVRLDHPRSDKEWRGTLAPENPAAWWQSYETMMVHLAQLSAREGAAVFSVGSELSTLDTARERPRWARLVEKIRREFRGLLTYSGNWDHYQDVGMYEHVDLAGMCAYFPLADRGYRAPADMDTLIAAWRKKRSELEEFGRRVGRPLLLTEVGYLSQRGAAAWPWNEGASEPIDLEDQRRCYQAFAEVWTGAAALRGVYFWNYYGWGGRISRGYTPRHKPAGQEIERYFLAESARPAL